MEQASDPHPPSNLTNVCIVVHKCLELLESGNDTEPHSDGTEEASPLGPAPERVRNGRQR